MINVNILIHEGVKYPCDKCKYAATTESSLKTHFEINHDGVKYPGDKSEFAATTARDLKQHIKSKHEGVKYSCPNVNNLRLQQAV